MTSYANFRHRHRPLNRVNHSVVHVPCRHLQNDDIMSQQYLISTSSVPHQYGTDEVLTVPHQYFISTSSIPHQYLVSTSVYLISTSSAPYQYIIITSSVPHQYLISTSSVPQYLISTSSVPHQYICLISDELRLMHAHASKL